MSDADHEVVDLAYHLWLERGFRGGTPEEDLLTALRMLRGGMSTVLFVVPKGQSSATSFSSLGCSLVAGES